MSGANVVVVGAGPAGVRACELLVAHGMRPILVDEARRPGGQGYRRIAVERGLDPRAIMGSAADTYLGLHRDFDAIRASIDYRPRTQVFAGDDGGLDLLPENGVAMRLEADAVILATGAMDRIMPVPGWTIPGVFTLGGAQIAMKDQACLVGKRIVFAGSSPLLSLAALQYSSLGAEVVAVCDSTPLSAKVRAGPDLFAAPAMLARGLGYLARLRGRGIPVHLGTRLHAVRGAGKVESFCFDWRGRRLEHECDAVAIGFGLKPETQLAELLGARFGFDSTFRLWLPRTDADGRAAPGLYLAGDGAAIGGADAAETSGRLAAYALLADFGHHVDPGPVEALRRRLARQRRFQRGLARAFSWPAESAADMPDEVMVCRCEGVSAGQIRTAVAADLGPVEVNRVKAITRCGMGRCQGRLCGGPLTELVANAAGKPLAEVGRLRGQAPVKPLPLAAAGKIET